MTKDHLIDLDVQLLDERVDVFELQNRELHEGLGDAVGDNTLRRWHGSKYNRK